MPSPLAPIPTMLHIPNLKPKHQPRHRPSPRCIKHPRTKHPRLARFPHCVLSFALPGFLSPRMGLCPVSRLVTPRCYRYITQDPRSIPLRIPWSVCFASSPRRQGCHPAVPRRTAAARRHHHRRLGRHAPSGSSMNLRRRFTAAPSPASPHSLFMKLTLTHCLSVFLLLSPFPFPRQLYSVF